MQVQYRNCNYIGSFNQQHYQRQGYGIAILDNSQIVMGKWKSDSLHGPFFIINDRMRVLGTMVNNKLEGYNAISIQESLISNKTEKQRTIYGMFRDNKLYGKALIIDDDQVIIAHYTNGDLRQISQKKPFKEKQVYEMLRACFPNEIYNIADWLSHIFQEAKRQFNNDGVNKYEPIQKEYEGNLNFYGFTEIFAHNKGIGFIMEEGQIVSVGEHDNDYLQGLGRVYLSDGTVEDGVFKNGQLCGIGVSYNKVTHKYILGEHRTESQSFQKGFGFPQKQVNEIRKQFHLRSINFYNDIVQMSFSTTFEAILANCLQFNIESESPRFSSLTHNSSSHPKRRGLPEKSPLKAKIIQYDQESERIEQPSPINDRPINQYERTDYRTDKYFDNSHLTESQQQPPVRQVIHSQSRNKSPSLPRPKQSESKSKYNGKKVKDTKQLVRQLDEKQRTRRGYLDQIYKQAKIYSRKG